MHASYYNQESDRYQTFGNQNDPDDEIDYSFSRLSVKERRKLFLDNQAPINPYQFGTLPRSFGSRARHVSQSDVGDWNSQIRRVSANRSQTFQRPASSYKAVSGRTLQLSPQRNRQSLQYTDPLPKTYYAQDTVTPDAVVNEQYIQPAYVAPRKSQQPSSQSSPTQTARVSGNYPLTPTPGTRVFYQKGSYNTAPQRIRETTSMTHEVTPTTVQMQQAGQPLRVRVYNNDRPAISPNYARNASNWGPTSPVYPAYPAYGPRPIQGNTQIYRVVQSPQKSYPRSIETSYTYAPLAAPATPICVPLTPKERRSNSFSRYPKRSITIYPSVVTKQDQARPTYIQPTHSPVKMAPPGTRTPMPVRAQTYRAVNRGPRQPAKQPVIVNRRAPPPPDEEIGVSEF